MSVAFFTEGGYEGKVPRNNPNMRTDQAWICALNAVHHCVFNLSHLEQNYDIGVVIIPKEKNREKLALMNFPLIETIRTYCNKVYVMQESIQWDWQDESFASMAWFYNQLTEADKILCHNNVDVPYFSGISNKPANILPTLMVEDEIIVANKKEDKVFIAGNWTAAYRGFDAWAIGNYFDLPMTGYKTGKFKEGEETNGINYLPWIIWKDFMYELSKHKYAVQCYPASAGQFPLNCGYLGIPCIGYDDVNTQKDLFPELSVKRGDILSAIKLVNKLKTDKGFYDKVSNKSKNLYNKLYTENQFFKNWDKIIK